ncbi:MAG: hypothetical protein ACK4F5_14030 [Aliihoeflea sp.]|jgi:hypothetical protein
MIAATRDKCLPDDFGATERAEMKLAIDAVCAELGLKKSEMERRHAVKQRVIDAYRNGRRHPLNLVDAGLGH